MIVSKSEIIDVFESLKKIGTVAPGIDKVTYKTAKRKKIFINYCDYIYDALEGKREYHFSKYKEVLKLKGHKKPRILSVPCIRDRIMLKVIQSKFLNEYANRIPFNKLIKEVSEEIKTNKYNRILKIDISGFFDNIRLQDIKDFLDKNGVAPHIVEIILCALKTTTINPNENSKAISRIDTCKTTGIPQGIIISNALAELIGSEIDNNIIGCLSKFGVCHFRFVDDIIVLLDNRKISQKKLLKTLRDILDSFGLKINNSKKEYLLIGEDINFLGYQLKKDKISIDNKILHKKANKIERIIFDFVNSYNKNIKNNYDYLVWKLNNEIAGFIANGRSYGWVYYYKMVDDLSVYYRLDHIVYKIYRRARLDMSFFPKIKKFAVAHKEVRKKKSTYFLNFDVEYNNPTDKRKFLTSIFNASISSLSDDAVEDLFDTAIQKTIYETERDLDLKFSI